MIAVDTNIVVRYLTGDHPEQSAKARALIDGRDVFVCVTVVLEVEWVLRSAYGYGAREVNEALRAFAGLPTVTLAEADKVAAALDLSDLGMDFADALHVGQSTACDGFATFDRKMARIARSGGFDFVQEV